MTAPADLGRGRDILDPVWLSGTASPLLRIPARQIDVSRQQFSFFRIETEGLGVLGLVVRRVATSRGAQGDRALGSVMARGRTCQSAKMMEAVTVRRCWKKSRLVPRAAMALRQARTLSVATVWKAKARRLKVTRRLARVSLPWPKLCSRW